MMLCSQPVSLQLSCETAYNFETNVPLSKVNRWTKLLSLFHFLFCPFSFCPLCAVILSKTLAFSLPAIFCAWHWEKPIDLVA